MALKFPDILQHNNTNYALIDSSQVRGTAYSITNLSDTGSIPNDKRNLGIIVFVSSEQKYYAYYGTTTNISDWNNTTNWQPLAAGQSAVSLGVIVTGSVGVNQTILGSLTINGGLIGTASFSSQSISSSYALTASNTPNAIVTASVLVNTITFTKGDSSSFTITVNTGSNSAVSFLGGITNGQILYNNSNTFAGVPGVSYNGTTFIASGSFSGSLQGTASFANTASLALNALTASLVITAETSSYPFSVTGSTIYSHNSNRIGVNILPITSTTNNFIVGESAGLRGFYSSSILIGFQAGYQVVSETGSSYNVFIGNEVGARSSNVSMAFLGLYRAGYQSQTNNSVFIGREAGAYSGISNDSIFLGRRAGFRQTNVSHSILIGYNVGAAYPVITSPIGSNNIIIGSNITLPPATSNSINIGGILFGNGTYSEQAGNPSDTAVADGKIGINVYPNNYNLEVNGTTNISNGLYVTNSINLSGSYSQIGNSNITGNTILVGNSTITGSLSTSGSNVFTGLQTISGSLNVMENLTVLGTASFYVFTTTYTTTSTIVATGSNTFGDTIDDIQNLIGTVNISGSLVVTGSAYLTSSNVIGGAVNYIPIWKTQNSLSTSSIYETGSNIIIGTTNNPNNDFKLHISGNLSVNSFQIASISSSQNLNYVGIWRPSGSSGNTNFLETTESNPRHKWVFRDVDGFNQKRNWDSNESSIVNINLGWGNPNQSLVTGSSLLINPHINITNGNAVSLRGIYYNPTITSSLNTTLIAIETTTGSIIFKNLVTASGVTNILLYDTASGQLYYTASNTIGGSGTGAGFPYSGSAVITGSLLVSGSGITGSLLGTASWASTASYALNAGSGVGFPFSGSAIITGSLLVSGSGIVITGSINVTGSGITGSLFGTSSWANNSVTASYVTGSIFTSTNLALSASYALTASNLIGGINNYLPIWTGSTQLTSSIIYQTGSLIGIRRTDPQFTLDISGSNRITSGSQITGSLLVSGAINLFGNQIVTGSLFVSGNLILSGSTIFTGSSIISGTLNVVGFERVSGSLVVTGSQTITSSTDNVLNVIGSGSLNPLFRVQGSLGEMFLVTDNISGSLLSINNSSGLPILEIFSDSTTKIGLFPVQALYTTNQIVANSGSQNTVYSLLTSSYEGAFYDYTLRSGSHCRAGQIMAVRSGSFVNYSEVATADFGNTSASIFSVSVDSSGYMNLNIEVPSNTWFVKSIIRSI